MLKDLHAASPRERARARARGALSAPRRPDVAAFLGPSLAAAAAQRLGPVRVLPPARAGDVLAVLPSRPLAIALVDGLFDNTPSVWHRELLAALEAGVAVFGGASLGALRAAELSAHGVVGVGRIFGWYRDGTLVDDGEVALLHADAEHGFRPLTLPLVQVRAAVLAARQAGALDGRTAASLVRAAAGLHHTERTWPTVLAAAGIPAPRRAALAQLLPRMPDVKASDAQACIAAAVAFAAARRAGAPAPAPPSVPPPSAHLRRLRLARAVALLAGGPGETRPPRASIARASPSPRRQAEPASSEARSGAGSVIEVPGAEILARLSRRPDAGRLAADGLRRLLLARWARSLGLSAGRDGTAAAERAWLGRLGAPPGGREVALAALGLDEGAARALAEDLELEARLLSLAARAVPDGPSWDEGLALGARLGGAWLEEAARAAGRRRPERERP